MEVGGTSVLIEQRLLKIQIQKSLRGRRAYTETLIPRKRNIFSEKIGFRHGTNNTQKAQKNVSYTLYSDQKEAPASPSSNTSSGFSSELDETRL